MGGLLDRVFLACPLVPPAVAYVIGICFGRYFEPPLVPLAVAISVFLSLVFFQKIRRAALILSFLFAGAFIHGFRYEIHSESDIRLLMHRPEALATVRGELLDTPAVRTTQYGDKEYSSSSARIRLHAIQFDDDSWQLAHGVIMTTTRTELGTNFFPGQIVEASGVLREPPAAHADGLFDYRAYLFNQRIFYLLSADDQNDWQILPGSPTTPPLTEQFRRWAKVQLARGIPVQDDALELIWAMTLGWKTALSGEMAQPFMRTGTLHIFAISGLHVACIAWLLLITSQLLGFPRHTAGLIVLPLLWFYTLSTGCHSSAVRSALMSSVLFVGWSLKRPANVLNSTAAAALIILLLIEPEQLFQAGFQLSFAVVASMALLIPVLEQGRLRILARDPFLPSKLRPGWIRASDGPVHWMSASLLVSLAAWLGSLPIVAHYFNLTTPVTLLANLLAVPLSSFCLASTLLSLVLVPCPEITNWVAWKLMHLTMTVTSWFAHFPLAYFYVPKPNWPFFIFYYSLIASVLSRAFWMEATRRWTISLIAALAVLWAGISFANRPTARITFLAAAGTPIYIDMPGRSQDLLVDCSNERDAEYTVTRWLRSRGVGSLSNLLLTHGDKNHAEGFFLVHSEFLPRRVYASPAPARSPTYKRAQASLKSSLKPWTTIASGAQMNGWKVLHPHSSRFFPRADDNCTVLYREIGGFKVLILSDLGPIGQSALMENHPGLRADIVLSGLPENGEPLSDDLLRHLSPSVIILGTTRYPANGIGSPALRDRLRTTGIPIFYTSDHGSVTLSWKSDSCLIESAAGKLHRLTPDEQPSVIRASAPQQDPSPPLATLDTGRIEFRSALKSRKR